MHLRGSIMPVLSKKTTCLTLALMATLGIGHSLMGMFWLFKSGSGSSQQDQTLLIAAKKGDFNAFKKALNKGGSIGAEDLFGKNSLHLACEHGHLAIVKYLLEKQISSETIDHFSKTALFYACKRGSQEIINALVAYGAKITPEIAQKYGSLIKLALQK